MGKIASLVRSAAAVILIGSATALSQPNQFASKYLTPKTESICQKKTQTPCLKALSNFSNFISSSSTPSNSFWIFSPNVDSCFYYRLDVPKNKNVDIGNPSRWKSDILQSQDLGIPKIGELGDFESRCMFLSNYQARKEAYEKTQTPHALAIKHFPGGNVEITETQMKVFECTLAQWSAQLAPFKDIINSNSPPSAIMIGHGSYPNIEKIYRGNHILSEKLPIPASISPYIINGLLRQKLSYTGAAISDWAGMGALNEFLVTYRDSLPKDMRDYGISTQKIILAIDANLNFLIGLNFKDSELPPHIMREISLYARSHPNWEKRFDEIIDFNLKWAKNQIPNLRALPSVKELSLFDKLSIFLGCKSINPKLCELLSYTQTNNFEDIWNRNGILSLLLRYYYVCEKTSRDYSKPTDFENLVQWAQNLRGNKSFWDAYSQIDWNCDSMNLEWSGAFESISSGN